MRSWLPSTDQVQGILASLAPGAETLDTQEMLVQYYGSVQLAMLTLFKGSTGGEDWTIYYETISVTGEFYSMIFILFIIFIEIALLNVLTGIFVESAMKHAQPDRDALALDLRKEERRQEEDLRSLCAQINVDGSGIHPAFTNCLAREGWWHSAPCICSCATEPQSVSVTARDDTFYSHACLIVLVLILCQHNFYDVFQSDPSHEF